jgi:hypothetical protein
MTHQQFRHYMLNLSRAWGPFTDAEQAHLDSIYRKRRTRDQDVVRPDVSDRVRFLLPGETLDNIKTIETPGEDA